VRHPAALPRSYYKKLGQIEERARLQQQRIQYRMQLEAQERAVLLAAGRA
jgi:hypothetical protein